MRRIIVGYGTRVTDRESSVGNSHTVSNEMVYHGDDEKGSLFLTMLLISVAPSKERHYDYVSYDTAGTFYGCGWRADSESDGSGMQFSKGQSMIVPGIVGRSMRGVALSLNCYAGARVYCDAAGPRMEITIKIPVPFAQAKEVIPAQLLDRLSRRQKVQVAQQKSA